MLDKVEDLKKSMDFLSEEVTTVSKQQKQIMVLLEKVKALKLKSEEKDKKIAFLENRVSELEQFTRMNDIIVSGLETKPRSYARAVSRMENNEPNEKDEQSADDQVTTFLQSKGIKVDTGNIEACHPLPRKRKEDKPAIIIRFVNRKQKMELLRQGWKLKGTEVYLNEHLTKKNADIAKKARFLRKQRKIQSTWTSNCKVFIKLNGTPEEARVLVIRNVEELEKYSSNNYAR